MEPGSFSLACCVAVFFLKRMSAAAAALAATHLFAHMAAYTGAVPADLQQMIQFYINVVETPTAAALEALEARATTQAKLEATAEPMDAEDNTEPPTIPQTARAAAAEKAPKVKQQGKAKEVPGVKKPVFKKLATGRMTYESQEQLTKLAGSGHPKRAGKCKAKSSRKRLSPAEKLAYLTHAPLCELKTGGEAEVIPNSFLMHCQLVEVVEGDRKSKYTVAPGMPARSEGSIGNNLRRNVVQMNGVWYWKTLGCKVGREMR